MAQILTRYLLGLGRSQQPQSLPSVHVSRPDLPYPHTQIHAYIKHTYTQPYIHTAIHTYIHTYIHTAIHTYI